MAFMEEKGGAVGSTDNDTIQPLSKEQRFIKRCIDIVISLCCLIALAPVLAIAAIAIKIEDGGCIIYRSLRVGESGSLFYMFKLRSMSDSGDRALADYGCDIDHKRLNDIRVTSVGRFLRRFSIDEIPQFCNVLAGDMSIVGPRPELSSVTAHYQPWQYDRLMVPQGITGWWQVSGRSNYVMHQHTHKDLYYIENYSIWLDITIMFRTIKVVIQGKGAY